MIKWNGRTVKPRIVRAIINDELYNNVEVWGTTVPKSNRLDFVMKHGKGKESFYTTNVSFNFKIVRKKVK